MIHPNSILLSSAPAAGRTAAPELPAAISSRAASVGTEESELHALIRRAQLGEMDAQSDLVRRYNPRVAGLVRAIVIQRCLVEDIAQVVMIKMVRNLGRLRDPRVFEPWLFTLARNAAYDHIRRRHCRPLTISSDQEFYDAPDAANPQALAEITEALDLALVRLKPKDRNLVEMIAQGHSYQTVAARSGLTTGAVKVRLHRVRPILRAVVGGAIGTHAVDGRKRRLAAAA